MLGIPCHKSSFCGIKNSTAKKELSLICRLNNPKSWPRAPFLLLEVRAPDHCLHHNSNGLDNELHNDQFHLVKLSLRYLKVSESELLRPHKLYKQLLTWSLLLLGPKDLR